MTEREGFEAFCKSTNPKYKTTDDSVIDRASWKIWREACAWQREQDATICDDLAEPGSYCDGPGPKSCAKAIRAQAPNA